MSKGLKALKHLGLDFENAFNKCKECNDTRDILKAWDFFFPYFEKDIAIIEKELKALEIIKDKAVNVLMFRAHFIVSKPEYEEYQYYLDNCEKYGFSAFYLTRQEFDLLKEVLL